MMVAQTLPRKIALSQKIANLAFLSTEAAAAGLWSDLPPMSQEQVARILAVLVLRMLPADPRLRRALDAVDQ
jgi:hypothetical protein